MGKIECRTTLLTFVARLTRHVDVYWSLLQVCHFQCKFLWKSIKFTNSNTNIVVHTLNSPSLFDEAFAWCEKKKYELPVNVEVKEFQISRGNKNVFNIIKNGRGRQRRRQRCELQHSNGDGYFYPFPLFSLHAFMHPPTVSSRWFLRHILWGLCVYDGILCWREACRVTFMRHFPFTCNLSPSICTSLWSKLERRSHAIHETEADGTRHVQAILLSTKLIKELRELCPSRSSFPSNLNLIKGNFRFAFEFRYYIVLSLISCVRWNFEFCECRCINASRNIAMIFADA